MVLVIKDHDIFSIEKAGWFINFPDFSMHFFKMS